MILNRSNKKRETLLKEFGKLKDDSFDFNFIDRFFRKKDHSGALQVLSDKTCADLDFHDLFQLIDRTNSQVGQQFLYDKLRIIPPDSSEVSGHEKLIDQFTSDENFRVNVQIQLSKLSKLETYYITTLFQDKHLQPPKWFFFVPLLSFTNLTALVLSFFNPSMLFVIFGVFLINFVIHYWNKKNIYPYIGSLPQLLRLKGVANELFKDERFRQINPDLQKSIDVLNQVRNRMSFFKLEAKLESDTEIAFWGILEFIKITFLLEPLFLFGILKRLNTKRKEIEDVFSFVGLIDALISIASYRNSLTNFCLPLILPCKKELIANDVYHPLICDCIENSIQLKDKSILLTGSNMSGKTSFIRTIGINTITGLTINTCCARHFSMPRLKIFSAIRISDDLLNDRSYYFEEVLTIKEMIDNSVRAEPNLFLLDEIFKGTNTIERISAGKAVLSYLTKTDNIVFVSTHDIELTDLLMADYDLYHFSEKVSGKTVDFDFKLKEGKLKNRNAIKILQINNYPESIINEAIEISQGLDKTIISPFTHNNTFLLL
jgi:DNA mismatch repair ATPase MutS